MVVAHGADDGCELRHLGLRQPRRGLVHEHEASARVASARATPRRRSSPWASAPGGPVRVAVEPEQAEQLAGSAAAPSAGDAPTPSAATSTFSRTESERNGWLCWNVRASPWRPRRLALQRVMSRPSSSTEPAVGRSNPVRRFTSVDLPAPFGPISPTTSWRCSVERDALHRVDAVERAREVGGPERSSGPPIRPATALLRRSEPSLDLRDDLRDDRADALAGLLFWIWITRYCRPNTEWSCGEKLTRPESVGTFLNFSIVAASTDAVRRAARPPDRGHDAVDGGRAGHEAARARLEGLRERVDRAAPGRRRRSTRT